MKIRDITSALPVLALVLACGGPSGDPGEAPDDSVSEQLASLPQDPAARAKALDALATEYPEDEQVARAMREFTRSESPALVREVEVEPGRVLTFLDLGETIAVSERGPDGMPSIVSERGLEGASVAELWRAVLPGEPLPESFIASDLEPPDEDAVPEAGVGAAGPAARHSPDQVELGEGVASTSHAYSTSAQHFLNAGGCANRPGLVNSDDYRNIVATYCNTGYYGEGMWTAYTSGGARWRVDSVYGGGFFADLRYNGASLYKEWVPNGTWRNFMMQNRYASKSTWCGIFPCSKTWLPTGRMELIITEATTDYMRIGAIYFNAQDFRTDAQPWL